MSYGRSQTRNSRTSARSGVRQQQRSPKKGGKRMSGEYNMLTFGVGFFDEDGKFPRTRILLKSDEARTPPTDEKENEYTREEAAELLKQALLEGRGISVYWFENDDGTMSGNARIDINGLELDEAPVPKKQQKSAAKRKPAPKYEVPEEDEETDDDEEEYEEADDSEDI